MPTAHYMMGGVEFAADCTTALRGLFVAGEDSGGVHGANRLGGNGVANSTVFGGIAGDAMAAWVGREGALHAPDASAIDAAIARAETPFRARAGQRHRRICVNGCTRPCGTTRASCAMPRASPALTRRWPSSRRNSTTGALPAGARDRAYNLSWHDWLNLGNLVAISRAIVRAAQAREDSRGAHFRADFPQAGDPAESTYTRIVQQGGALDCEQIPVRFTRVRPGESLVVPQ